jgi:hypothetical protein
VSPVRASTKRRLWPDVFVCWFFILAAVYVTFPLWVEPGIKTAHTVPGDQALFQWFLAHAARAVTHLENPLTTTLLNAPEGINMMANTSIVGLAIPLMPVTLLFGAHVSLLVALTLALAGTAAGWYFLLSRHGVESTFAAAVGGWFCGFSPVMISHASWHPNLTFQLLVPLIVYQVLKLREPGRAFRNGVILALLVAYQAFINEEILLFAAFGCGVFVIAYALENPPEFFKAWRPMLASLTVTAIVAGVLLAYPLWIQFFGPHHYRGLPSLFQVLTIDISSIVAFATESLAGSGHWVDRKMFAGESEESIYFGRPLLAVLILVLFLVRKRAAGRAIRVTGFVALILGLGAELRYRGAGTGIRGPWEALRKLPILDSVVPTRFGFVVTIAVGVLLALATQQVWDYAARRTHSGRWRGAWILVLAIGLVPVAPTPLDTRSQSPVPRFITEGAWRSYVRDGKAVVPLPYPTPNHTDGMRWAAAADAGFAIPGGYFLFPSDGIEGRSASFGSPLRPTSQLLDKVESTGVAPRVSDLERRAAVEDLRFWEADLVVLPADERNAGALRGTVEALLGPAELVQDVWLWPVRDGALVSVESGRA